MEAHQTLRVAYQDTSKDKSRLESRLERIKDLYKWGDISREEYQREKDRIHQELQRVKQASTPTNDMERLARFLANVAEAWEEANQEQRNELVRCLFQEVWVKDKQVVAVKPQPELEPFFKLNYEEAVNKIMKIRPRGGRTIMLDLALKRSRYWPHCI